MTDQDWVEGDEELLANFDALVDVMSTAIVQAGLAGAEVIHDAAVDRAPGPHLGVKLNKVSSEHVDMQIGPDKEHWYYRFFEFGAQPHEIGLQNRQALKFGAEPLFAASGDHPGLAAQPFLRPAMDENKDEVLKAMAQVYWKKITEAID